MHHPFSNHRGKLASSLLIFFIVHFGLYGLIIITGAFNGRSILCSLAICLLIFSLLHVAAVMNNFWTAWKHRTPREPEHELNWLETLRLFWGEYWITFRTYSGYFPFENLLVKPAPIKTDNSQPIILVPGFACNRGYWGSLRRYLNKQSYKNVYACTLEPVLGSIKENAECLAKFVDAVQEKHPEQKVILVAHSMGGVTARYYVHDLGGEEKVLKIISLGAPHAGTVGAIPFAKHGKNLTEMLPKNKTAAEFNKNQDQPCPVEFINVVTTHDNIVAPQINSWVKESYGKNIVLKGIGHLEMVDSKPVFEVVLQELQK